MPAETDGSCQLDPFDLPGEALAQPRVRLLDLVTVLDPLVKHAVLVADAVTDDRQPERRTAVQETGRQPAESAVAEPRVVFTIVDVFETDAQAVQCLSSGTFYPEADQRVAHQAAHQELERQVADATAVRTLDRYVGAVPALHQAVANGKGKRLVDERQLLADGPAPQRAAEIVREVLQQVVGAHPERRHLQQLDVVGADAAGGFRFVHCAGLQSLAGFSIRVASGGSVRLRCWSWPCRASARVSSSPRFSTPEPA